MRSSDSTLRQIAFLALLLLLPAATTVAQECDDEPARTREPEPDRMRTEAPREEEGPAPVHQPPVPLPSGFDRTRYEPVGPGVSTGIPDPGALQDQIELLGGMVHSIAGCEEGTLRFPDPDNIAKTCEWILPAGEPEITISSDSDHGHYAIPGAEEYLGQLREAFRFLPGPGGQVASFSTRVGDAITRAGARLGERLRGQVVNVTVTYERIRLTVECAPAEICVDGQFQAAGLAPVRTFSEPHRPSSYSQDGVGIAEVPGVVLRAANRAGRSRWNAYDADPCGCGGGETGTGGGTAVTEDPPATGPDCEELRRQLRGAEGALETARRVLELYLADREILERAYRDNRRLWEDAQEQADREYNGAVERLQVAEAQLQTTLDNMRHASTDTERDRISEAYEDWSGRVDLAREALGAARSRARELSTPPPELDRFLDELVEALEHIAEMRGHVQRYEQEVADLRRQLQECEGR